MKFIKIHHSIWTLSLSSNAFRTYCSLLSFMNTDTSYANVAMHKLATTVGLSEKSISRGIRELVDARVISVVEKHFHGHRLANGYLIIQQYGRYTKFPASVISAPVSSTGFMLYAYLLKCADKSYRAFPSLSGIAAAIGATVKTVVAQIKELIKLKLLNKKNQTKRDGSFGYNLYQIFGSFIGEIQKEKTRLARVSSQSVAKATSTCKFNILLKNNFVKGMSIIFSFFKKRVLTFCPNKY